MEHKPEPSDSPEYVIRQVLIIFGDKSSRIGAEFTGLGCEAERSFHDIGICLSDLSDKCILLCLRETRRQFNRADHVPNVLRTLYGDFEALFHSGCGFRRDVGRSMGRSQHFGGANKAPIHRSDVQIVEFVAPAVETVWGLKCSLMG
jgi:hypothetical protein